jgi:membrane-associated protein
VDLTIISQYIHSYGYIVILLVLFCGIVGIPAPEESFLILLGMFIAKHQLNLYESSLFAFLGVITGMLTAYGLGRYAGTPFFDKYGKYVGLTKEKIEAASGSYHKYGIWTILFGLYIPGLRQISPYGGNKSLSVFPLFIVIGSRKSSMGPFFSDSRLLRRRSNSYFVYHHGRCSFFCHLFTYKKNKKPKTS